MHVECSELNAAEQTEGESWTGSCLMRRQQAGLFKQDAKKKASYAAALAA